MTHQLQLGGDREGEVEGLIVLLHGLDHSPEPMMPLVRALSELRRFMESEGVPPPRLRVLAPYRGGGTPGGAPPGDVTLESLVEGHYAPVGAVPGEGGVPIVTIGESLGAALSDVWSWREPRIVHQVWLDPFPARLELIALDRALAFGAMAFQRASFRLRRLGVNLTGLGDRALLRASLNAASRADRERYLRLKMEAAHWRHSLREARLIALMALRGASAPPSPPPADRLTPVTAFLPPRGTSWLERKVIGPAVHRIAVASFSRRRGARIVRARAGTHYNLAEMAAPYVAWRALAGLTASTAGRERARELFGDWPLAARFAERYWTSQAGESAPAPDLAPAPLADR